MYSKNGERLDLVSAVNLVPEELRIHGFEVRYLSDDGSWIDVTFTGDSIENWSTESNWNRFLVEVLEADSTMFLCSIH